MRAFFFVSGHVPPLLRSFEKLFLYMGIASLLGESFALARFGAIFFCLGRQCSFSVRDRQITNVNGKEQFRAFTYRIRKPFTPLVAVEFISCL